MKCPFCAEIIKNQAVKCKHCGEWLDRNREKAAPNHQKKDKFTADPTIKLGSMEIFKDGIMYENEFVYNSEITGLKFNHYEFSMNFMNMVRCVSIRVKAKGSIYSAECNLKKKDDKLNLFISAIRHLDKQTINNRFDRYISELSGNGFIRYVFENDKGKEIPFEIYPDGKIKNSERTYDRTSGAIEYNIDITS